MPAIDPLTAATPILAILATIGIPMTFALRLLRRRPDSRSLAITFATLGVTMFVLVPITLLLVMPHAS